MGLEVVLEHNPYLEVNLEGGGFKLEQQGNGKPNMVAADMESDIWLNVSAAKYEQNYVKSFIIRFLERTR